MTAWLRRFLPADRAATRLVCFPHAGGAATYYFPMARALHPSVEVLAVQYPGRQDRRTEPCVDDIGELADAIARELHAWADRPLALFGHSMGSTVAYEVARRLERSGITPVGLFASAGRGPSALLGDTVHLRDDDGLVAALRALSGTEQSVLDDEELLSVVLPAVRGDYKAVETYRHTGEQRLTCPVRVLVGETDEMTTPDQAAAWHSHTTAHCEVTVFPGGHFYLNDQLDTVMRAVTRQLLEWTGPTTRAWAC
jgi:surfactin synthase thioesterase subunit